MSARQSRIVAEDGVLTLEVFQPRKSLEPLLLWRRRWSAAEEPVELVLGRMGRHERAMAERLLAEGAGRRRRWSSLVAKPPTDFYALAAEEDVVPRLVGCGALQAWDRWDRKARAWHLDGLSTTPAGLQAIDRRSPQQWRAELTVELHEDRLLPALARGPRAPMSWRAFAIVLRAAQLWLEMVDGGRRPDERELAGLVGDTKALRSRARRTLLAELVETAPEELFEQLPRVVALRGPLDHDEGDVWDTTLSRQPPVLRPEARAIFCVENLETFRRMSELADADAVVLHVPGGPPPAEALLLEQLHLQSPRLPVYAVFDPDPAGIRIALILQRRASASLLAELMSPELLALAPQRELVDWDRKELRRLAGHADVFEPLRAAIETLDYKGEQEPVQRELLALAWALLPDGPPADD